MGYYLKCNRCGKAVSSPIPGGAQNVTIRAWIECPECIAAKEQFKEAMREPCEEFIWAEVQKWCQGRIAEAVAAEREACVALLNHLAESSEKLAERASQLDNSVAHDMSVRARALRSAAGRIRARGGGIDVQRDDRDDIDWLHTDLEG